MVVALVAALFIFTSSAFAVEQTVALSPSIGDEIDRAERDAYHLFPDVSGFVSARIVKLDKGYRVDFTYRDNDQAVHEGSRHISDETFENTRLHAGLVEAARGATSGDAALDARVLYGTALRLAARRALRPLQFALRTSSSTITRRSTTACTRAPPTKTWRGCRARRTVSFAAAPRSTRAVAPTC